MKKNDFARKPEAPILKTGAGTTGALDERVDAILMASGRSRRFGAENKLLVPFRGKPLARHTLDLLAAHTAYFNQIFFITAEEAVRKLAEDMPVITQIHNSNPERGQRESIRLGALHAAAGYLMFFACDQALLDGATVLRLYAARKKGAICLPEYQGKTGSPALFSRTFRDELASLKEGERGKDVILRHLNACIHVPLESPVPLVDVDTREILHELETSWRHKGPPAGFRG
ncbi:MAG: nucleotidyltransferase family protein [Spirochaetaceae bacterium]|nr:nucleotidyltransferase family protein [Spirochaetaceae bacterium]